jgi:hypoxanthine phosphoribosyltransferase
MNIQVHDKQFEPYITAVQLQTRIREMATEITRDYKKKRPVFLAILNGAFMFMSDLLKEVNIEAEVCFIKLASYKGTTSTGQVITAIGLDVDLFGKEVIIVEDIVDTGKTLSAFIPQLMHQQPASMKIAALLHKPEATVHPLEIRYLGFSIPNKFVVGFGLDYDGLGRNIPEIYRLVE